MTIMTGCALDSNNYYVSTISDEIDFEIECCQMVLYDYRNDSWCEYHNNMEWRAESISLQTLGQEWKFFAINGEGKIEAFSKHGTKYDEILDAGIHKQDRFYGSINKIRNINNQMFACGDRGQIYTQTNGQWEHYDSGLLMDVYDLFKVDRDTLLDLNHISPYTNIYDINHLGEHLYVCGDDEQGGFIAIFKNEMWEKIVNAEDCLLSITQCPDGKNLIICGNYGQLLKGNMQSGFKEIASNGLTYYDCAFYHDELYLASTQGIYRYMGASDFELIAKVPQVEINHIEEKDGVLWAVSFKHIYRYDGIEWVQIKHPNNND